MENEPTKLGVCVDTPEQLQASLAADANQGDQQEQPQTQEAPAVQQEPTPEPEPQQYTQPEQQAQPEQYTQPEYQQETQQYTQPEYQQPIKAMSIMTLRFRRRLRISFLTRQNKKHLS